MPYAMLNTGLSPTRDGEYGMELLELVNEGLIAVDTHRRVSYINRQAGKMLRIDHDAATGATLDELFAHWRDTDFARQCDAVAKTRRNANFHVHCAKTSEVFDLTICATAERGLGICVRPAPMENLSVQAATSRDDDGQLRKLYEIALSATSDLIYIFDPQGRFIYGNPAVLRMWGYTWDQAMGKTCLELGYEPWHAEMHEREIEQVIATRRPIRGDATFTGPAGTATYDYIFVPVIGNNGEVEAIAGTSRDVTARRAMEDEIRKAEERQRAALDASHSFGTWDWDVRNDVFTADARFAELYGLTREQYSEGVSLDVPASRVHEDDRERVTQHIARVLDTGGRYHEEYRVRLADGSIRWLSTRGRVELDASGKAIRFPGAGVDITAEREALEALREADRKKDEFLAILAHELRNPLAPIRNALGILQTTGASTSDVATAHALIERQTGYMSRLIDDLMDVSRITRGTFRLQNAAVDLRAVITDAVEAARVHFEQRSQRLHVDIPEQAICIDGDFDRMSQILGNLLNNASKYTPAGGQISVTVGSVNEQVLIEVQDDGIGICADELTQVFEPFSRGDNASNSAGGGLGIGLTLVKQLVELHGGTITVLSAGHGRGSTFSLHLPQQCHVSDKAPAAASPSRCSPAHTHKLKVLVVDDNVDSAKSLGWLIKSMDCEVEVAFAGPAAIEIANTFLPELVFLDIGMPGMDGYEICETLRATPQLAHCTFVAQTGWGQQEDIARAHAAGFHHHLIKPVELAALKSIVSATKASAPQPAAAIPG